MLEEGPNKIKIEHSLLDMPSWRLLVTDQSSSGEGNNKFQSWRITGKWESRGDLDHTSKKQGWKEKKGRGH